MPEEKTAAPLLADVSPIQPIVADKERAEYERRRGTIIKKRDEKKALYWFGTLPGPLSYKLWNNGVEILFPGNEDFENIGHVDPLRNPRGWMGKCKHFQSLNIAGLEFPAYTNPPSMTDTGEYGPGDVRPGHWSQLDAEQIVKVREMAFKVFYRASSEKRGYVVKEDSIGYTADPIDMPLAHYVYLVPLKSIAQIPQINDFFMNPPKSLAGD